MKKLSVLISGLVLVGLLLYISCGGGGGGGGDSNGSGTTPAGLTTFTGGSLADLQKLSSNLTFDELQITGKLALPSGSTTIKANKLTITSNGGIEYSYDTCTHAAAPDLTLSVTGDVVIDGSIYLPGQNGERTAYNATCKSCYGQRGGDIAITGNTIKMTGTITNKGGDGSKEASPGESDLPCPAGDSGNVKLAAVTTMDLNKANIKNSAGVGYGGNGGSGTVNISAGGAFTMRDGNIDITGAMTFSAATTDIWGTIHYGTLTETIGGVPDSTNPTIAVLSSNITGTFSEYINVMVQASDVGMGLRGVRLQGLGSNKTYDIADCGPESASCTSSALDSKLTMSFYVNSPTSPATLQVTAIDNKGNTTTVPVTGILIAYPVEKEPNDSLAQAQTLNLNGGIKGNIQTGDAGYIWIKGSGTNEPPPILQANKSGEYKVEDLYKVKCCTVWTQWRNCYTGDPSSSSWTCYAISISVDFSGSASVTPDIDVYLFYFNDHYYDASSTTDNVKDNNYTESFTKVIDANLTEYDPGSIFLGKDFYIGIQAWDVPTRANYTINYNGE